ncbi:MAG: NAD(P)/FAD-dependent oxidoreductase [Candidatus Omnitrophota bacterium]|nr:NAD(P)/FAD-dependent oxidoreductase [Candidatus Omnitrophota bacterium]
MQYDAIIIGAGVGGLFSAFKLSSAGKKVLLIEKQPLPGGYATVFQRKGFTFESAVHCVDSLGEGGEMREFLEETGIARKIDFIKLKDFGRIIFPGHDFIVTTRRDDFISFLKNNFPQESKNIDRVFCEFDKFYRQFDRFCDSRLPHWIKMALTPFIYRYIIKMSVLNIGQVVNSFIKDKKLQGIITAIWGFLGLPPSEVSAFYFLIVFRGYYLTPTAYIKGGFIQLFYELIKQIQQSGSEVRFNTAATKIVTDNGKKLKCVVTDKGDEFKARVVISNVNAIDTLCGLIDSDAVKEKYSRKLSSLEKSISAFQVYLGLRRPAKDLGMTSAMFCINTTYDHGQAFGYALSGDYQRCQIALVDHGQIDPGLLPQGKGSLLIFALDDYGHWEGLDEEDYNIRKREVADKLISRAEIYLPGLSENIEVMEVATPRTMERFSSCPQGAIYGFSQRVNQASINRLSQKTLVKGLILSGAWTRPGGGIHGCFVSAIEAADAALQILK